MELTPPHTRQILLLYNQPQLLEINAFAYVNSVNGGGCSRVKETEQTQVTSLKVPSLASDLLGLNWIAGDKRDKVRVMQGCD